jgi:Sec-independent protein translocase protein TatA
MGRNVGLGIKEFKKGLAEATSDDGGPATQDGKQTASDERGRGTTA